MTATAATPPPAAVDDVILRADKVTMRFGGLIANKDVDFDIPRGAIVSLIGPNGAGKTTFFNQLTGMLDPTSGDITFEGTSLLGLTPHEIVELGIGRTFQNIRLFGAMTVLANVMVGRHSRMKASWWGSLLRLPAVREEEAAVAARARELLEMVGLPRRYEEDWAKNLPYGDQRRLELARALASDPKLLLLDEPTAGMGPGETEATARLIESLNADGVTIMVIEHDMAFVRQIARTITVMNLGRIFAEGTIAEIEANQGVTDIYLGRV
jgi:branched-chain amino acid transport system ATP-binding protein